MSRPSRSARLLLVVFGIVAGILFGEVFFRLVPYERVKYEARYGHFRGNEVSKFLEYDPQLTFRNRRGASFPDAGVSINALGLRGPEVTIAKPAGVRRVLCLGDSCTFGAGIPYPELLQKILDARAPGKFQVLNGGVIGYTSVHGLEWMERDLAPLAPDVVTIYYGWNDMWREKDSAVRRWFKNRVEGEAPPRFRSYLWDALSRLAVYVQNSFGTSALQVPPEQYRAVLEHFAKIGRSRGFQPIYVTGPSGFDGDRTPQWLVDKGFVARADSAPRLHAEYNAVVAEVSRAVGAPLVDVAADFDRSGGRALFADPAHDPIHPNARGYQKIAEDPAEAILNLDASATPAAASR